MRNQNITLFNPEEKENDFGFSKRLEFCFKEVHFFLEVWSVGDRHSSTEGYKVRVVGTCDLSCNEAYHKKSNFGVMLEKEIEWIDDKDSECILVDIPLLVKDFMEKGIIGESLREFNEINDFEYPEKVRRPKD